MHLNCKACEVIIIIIILKIYSRKYKLKNIINFDIKALK
jgi:hypothetical protein